MTDKELAAIRRRLAESTGEYAEDWLIEPSDVEVLLAEVERLRASLRSHEYADTPQAREALEREHDRFMAEHEAMREIMEAVAKGKTIYYASHEGTFCVLCSGYVPGNVNVPDVALARFPHSPDCPVTKARALLTVETE